MIPAGNTGQPPGPIISHLNSVGLPTRIESGSVWISKDTLLLKKGELIDERLASVLSKLGVKPVESGLMMNVAYDEGTIIPQELLEINVDGKKQAIKTSHADAFALSISIAYPTRENTTILILNACRNVFSLSLSIAFPTKETISDLIRKGYTDMLILKNKLSDKK